MNHQTKQELQAPVEIDLEQLAAVVGGALQIEHHEVKARLDGLRLQGDFGAIGVTEGGPPALTTLPGIRSRQTLPSGPVQVFGF